MQGPDGEAGTAGDDGAPDEGYRLKRRPPGTAAPTVPLPTVGDGAIDAPSEGGGGPCARDPGYACASGNGVGYTCQGLHSPEEAHPSWVCGSALTTASTTSSYCCWTCGSDSAVTGCPLHNTGESCDDTDTPNQDFNDNCSATSSAGIGAHGFCCTPIPASSSCTTNSDCSGYSSYAVCGAGGKCILASGAIGGPARRSATAAARSSATAPGAGPRAARPTRRAVRPARAAPTSACRPAARATSASPPARVTTTAPSLGTFCLSGRLRRPTESAAAYLAASAIACSSSSDCTGSLTCSFDLYACTQTCTGTSDTSCGTNANGRTNLVHLRLVRRPVRVRAELLREQGLPRFRQHLHFGHRQLGLQVGAHCHAHRHSHRGSPRCRHQSWTASTPVPPDSSIAGQDPARRALVTRSSRGVALDEGGPGRSPFSAARVRIAPRRGRTSCRRSPSGRR